MKNAQFEHKIILSPTKFIFILIQFIKLYEFFRVLLCSNQTRSWLIVVRPILIFVYILNFVYGLIFLITYVL